MKYRINVNLIWTFTVKRTKLDWRSTFGAFYLKLFLYSLTDFCMHKLALQHNYELLYTSYSGHDNVRIAVLGIRDIRCGSGSADPYLRLMDPDPDTTPDPTSFFIDFKDTKKIFFSYFFRTCQQTHHLQSKKFNYLLKFCVKIIYCRRYYSPLNTSMRKGKDPDPYLLLLDPDPGGPTTCGSLGSGSGSPTLAHCFPF